MLQPFIYSITVHIGYHFIYFHFTCFGGLEYDECIPCRKIKYLKKGCLEYEIK